MTVIVKTNTGVVVPPSVQRQAGIKIGDRLEFKVSSGKITIIPAEKPAYKPTKSESAAIRKGEAAIARGEMKVTGIEVNGTSTGLTSGQFFVNGGGTIRVSGSVEPTTWNIYRAMKVS